MKKRRSGSRTTAHEPETILDFGCGHGRVMRYLKARYPGATLTAYDIDSDGVRFCAETFGAIAALTEEALESYELIWCGSVLTHVHPGTWTRFLDVFEVHLKPGGYLVFSTAGRRVAARLRDNPRLDLGLTSEAKHRLLDAFGVGRAYEDYPQQSGYGISLAQPSFVMGLLEQRPPLRLVSFDEMAHQGRA